MSYQQQAYGKKREIRPDANRIGPRNFSSGEYANKEVAAVIVTISDSTSFDHLFQQVEQTPPNPETEYVSVFQISSTSIKPLLEYFRDGKEIPANSGDLLVAVKEINSIEGDCVVFNWECCEGCSETGFSIESEIVFQFVKELLDRKMLCMFSDFSLKALIATWDSKYLGPNPFINVGEFDDSFDLAFSPEVLLDCPSIQLQKVGNLCNNGTAHVSALGGTILYTVKSDYRNASYELTVLTVVTKAESQSRTTSSAPECKIGDVTGLAGHVTLSYPSGGIILTSCGHWIELVKLDVSVENVIKAAAEQYGETYAEQLRADYSCADDQEEFVQSWSKNYVQSAAPCKYKSMSKVSKK